MFCIECGKEIPDGVKFCPECGASQIVKVEEKPNKKLSKKQKLGIVCLILGILVLISTLSFQIDSVEDCIEEGGYPRVEDMEGFCEYLQQESIDAKQEVIVFGFILLIIGVVSFVFGGRGKE